MNILLFHCHDLGSHLGCYGIPTVRTPNLDKFASQGLLFERAFCTAPQCSPSRASMFTGRYPHSNGVMGLTHGSFEWDLHPEEKHLAQILRGHGYRTAAVGVLHESRRTPEACGFDRREAEVYAKQTVDATIRVLRDFASDPSARFYLQAGTYEPHRLRANGEFGQGFLNNHIQPDTSRGITVPPYLVDDEGSRVETAELQGAISHVDSHFGRLMEALTELDLWKNTLVLFTTDHGIAMPRAKCTLYEPGLGIALLMQVPGERAPRGVRIPGLVSNVDLVPTLLDWLQLPPPSNVQGHSYAWALRGQPATGREYIFGELTYHEYYDPARSVRSGSHKLILFFSTAPAFMDCSQSWRPRSITKTPADPVVAYHPQVELYDLESDPWEQHDLAREPAWEPVRQRLLTVLAQHLRETDDPILRGPIPGPTHAGALRMLLEVE